MVRNLRTLLALLLALLATASPAQTSEGVIRIVVPFGAGGVQDILARSFNAELGALLGRSVIVENRTGAGGTIGNASVAKALPDGHTLLLAAASHTITGSLYAKLPYHPINDFTGIAHIGSVDYVLMTSADVSAKNLKEFVSYSKSNPGKLNYASAGNGSATHLSMAYLASLTGLDMVHVPLKSTAEAINEVIAGRAHAVIASNIGALPFAKDPRVRMLGVTGSKRSRFLAELPTLAESGATGYEFDSWLGLLGPAGVPKAVVDQLNATMATLLKDPLILERLARQGIEPRPLSPDAFSALLREDFVKMARVVKISGARID
jgi:tripartite-type tricarboxylate transporter receptor subunit TctC